MQMADVSNDAFEEAIRRRAMGAGLVPMDLIRQLTFDQWSRVRLLSQSQARKLVAVLDAAPLGSRTKTPTMDSDTIQRLLHKVKDGSP